VLGTGADIYLLDEPTKGLDAGYKKALQDVIHDQRKKGKTIVTVSHDMEFVIRAADRCLMMFRGDIISDGQTREVFCGNSFYTTQVNRMAGHIRPGALLPEDIADLTRECRLEEE
jgi:energy-coupling factor transport system ATP-binding protein